MPSVFFVLRIEPLKVSLYIIAAILILFIAIKLLGFLNLILKRNAFMKKLKKYGKKADAKLEINNNKYIFRSNQKKSRDFTLETDRHILAVKLLALGNKFTRIFFRDDGYVVRFSFDAASFESKEKKLLSKDDCIQNINPTDLNGKPKKVIPVFILIPSPSWAMLQKGTSERHIDEGIDYNKFKIFTSKGFLSALERPEVFEKVEKEY